MESITVIGPCYNEEQNIDDFVSRTIKILEKINLNYQILLVDDGSQDNTWEKILSHSKKNNKIKGIKLTRNFGHQNAIMAGIKFCESDYVLLSDVDLQDPPELLEEMYNKITENKLNVIFAKRVKSNESFFKKLTSIIFYKIYNLISHTKIVERASDFVLFNKKVLKEIKSIKEQDVFLRGLIPWLGFNSSYVEFERQNRKKGSTGWSIYKMINFALTAFLSYSSYPMRFSFILSFLCIMFFFILSIYAIYSYLINDIVKGWTSLFLIISFFNTIVFFILGVMGEYVGRIYLMNKNKPLFIIDEISSENENRK